VGLFYFENVYGLRSRIFIINHVNLEVNHHMQVTGIVVTVVFAIILFEVLPEKSVWSIPVRQAEEHMIAVPGSGGFSFLLMQKQEAYKTLTKEKQRFWKRILIVDDDVDITTTFKAAIEDSNIGASKRIEVYTSNVPVGALSEFKPNFYDLLLVDINMPHMNGFELCEKILAIDINVRICFMSSGEINRKALREIYPSLTVGCFMRKPMAIGYLLERIRSELD
jgi:CheY-like chemotaxis protein